MANDLTAESELAGDHDADSEENGLDLKEVHERAMQRFDSVADPQWELRAQSLADRRFTTVPGAMWEDSWGAKWGDAMPRPEVDLISKSQRKVLTDHSQNRMIVNFRPASDKADDDTAAFLDGLYRADDNHFKSRQARDNAFLEALQGGFGAYRLLTDYTDPYDKDDDSQRVCPGRIIPDADQRVYFDIGSSLYDKSDAQWAFVVHFYPRAEAERKYGDDIDPWPVSGWQWAWDWYRPEAVQIAEYYEVEEKGTRVLIFTNELTDEEQRFFEDELDAKESSDLTAQGWKRKSRPIKRRRVHKYIMSGSKVIKDGGFIAGDAIPIVPVYGKRVFVDGMERWEGHTRKEVDKARIFNAGLSRLTETDSFAPNERPIFYPDQVKGHEDTWARGNVDRLPYQLINPMYDENGGIIANGQAGVVAPPQVPPTTAALLQISMQLAADQDQNADQVKANVSADAMDIAASRVDEKSGLYLDNMAQSIQREGEIYLGMAREVYVEPGRKVETMDAEDQSATETLMEPALASDQVFRIRNDLTVGRYKVVSSVQEATATKRDKAVRQSLNVAELALKAGAQDIATACILNAIENQDGEGMDKLQNWSHKKAVELGLDEPTDTEKQEMAQAAQGQQPSPTDQAMMAKAQELGTQAQLNEASTQEKLASAALKTAQAQSLSEAPKVEDGLSPAPDPVDQVAKLATADHATAQAEKIRHEIREGGIESQRKTIRMGRELDLAERQHALQEKQAQNGGAM